MDKANGVPIRTSLTIRETKVQELQSMDPGLKKKQACRRHSARSKRSMAGGAIERKEITLSSRRRSLSRLMRWRSWAWRRRNTKVAAKLGTESVEKVMEKADMAALQLCKEKESIATWPGCSTELKKWSNCYSRS